MDFQVRNFDLITYLCIEMTEDRMIRLDVLNSFIDDEAKGFSPFGSHQMSFELKKCCKKYKKGKRCKKCPGR